jgi:pyruvate,water dikinase
VNLGNCGTVALEEPLVAWFDDALAHSATISGGKGASLSRLKAAGLPVPRGFVVCAAAFSTFLNQNGGGNLVLECLTCLDIYNDAELELTSSRIRDFILLQPLSNALTKDIEEAYRGFGEESLVAVRSSAIGEDGEAASFAGQQETFLNIRGADNVTRCVKECWASFFTPRALFYRAQKGELTATLMAVVVQEMVFAEKSGVMFTVDPVQNRRDHIVVEAVFGLGEGVVSGLITPDQYVLDRASGSLVREFIALQPTAVVCDAIHGGTRHIQLSTEEGSARVLNDRQVSGLRDMGLKVEAFFGSPQDVEWCICGDELLLLQSRPITTL